MKLRPKMWVLQLVLWALLVGEVISVCRFLKIKRENEGLDPKDDGYQDTFPTILALQFLTPWCIASLCAYSVVCEHSGTREFVANVDGELNVQQYVEQLRSARPGVRFTACCYHFENHSRSDGKGSERVRVVTRNAHEDYSFTQWEDATLALSGTDSVLMTKLHLSKELGFLTKAGYQRFRAAFESFCEHNRWDTYQAFNQELRVDGFQERVLCLRNADEAPFWVGRAGYGIASLLCLNVPYRQFLDWNTGSVRHTITKKIA